MFLRDGQIVDVSTPACGHDDLPTLAGALAWMARNGVILRLARRSLLRDRWRALLVVVLIGLPVMGIATAALVLETAVPTPGRSGPPERWARRTCGSRPSALLAGPGCVGCCPAGSSIQPIWATGDRVIVPGCAGWPSRAVHLSMVSARGWSRCWRVDCRSAMDEVAISRVLATRTGVGIGGTLDLEALGHVRVVGTIEDPRDLARSMVLGAAALADAPDQWPVWLVRLPADADVGAVASRIGRAIDPANADLAQPMFDVETRAQAGTASETFVTVVVTLGALALVESALVASAAFAVGIRRRQRELGLLGAVGTTPRQMAGSVLAEGLLAGAAAVIVGIVLGLDRSVAHQPPARRT